MARPKVVRGTYINILLGNGAAPEVFTPLCGATTRSLNEGVETSDDYTRDCAIPDDIPTRNIIATGKRWDLAFNGVLNREQLKEIQDANGVLLMYRFEIAQPAGDTVTDGGGYYEGEGMMDGYTITGDDGANATIEGTIKSNGPWDWTVVP